MSTPSASSTAASPAPRTTAEKDLEELREKATAAQVSCDRRLFMVMFALLWLTATALFWGEFGAAVVTGVGALLCLALHAACVVLLKGQIIQTSILLEHEMMKTRLLRATGARRQQEQAMLNHPNTKEQLRGRPLA